MVASAPGSPRLPLRRTGREAIVGGIPAAFASASTADRASGASRPRPVALIRVGKPGLVRSTSGPWRGTKPMEGSGVARWQRRYDTTDSSAEQGPVVGRSRRLEGSARVASVTRAHHGCPRLRPSDGPLRRPRAWVCGLPRGVERDAMPAGDPTASSSAASRGPWSGGPCSRGCRFAGDWACVGDVGVRFGGSELHRTRDDGLCSRAFAVRLRVCLRGPGLPGSGRVPVRSPRLRSRRTAGQRR